MAKEPKQNSSDAVNEENMDAILRAASETGDLDSASTKALINLMLMKEKRLILKEAELERVQHERDEQAKKSSEAFTLDKMRNQRNCSHLKGGKSRQRGQQKDPAVYAHTFTDGKTVIKCQLCGAKWMQGDTAEFIKRGGSPVPNWTGIGWREAVALIGESSNRPSSSERVFERAPDGIGADMRNEEGKIELPKNLQF